MKHFHKFLVIAILLALAVALILPGQVSAKGLLEDKVIFGESYTLNSGDSLSGNLTVVGGAVTVENGAYIEGDVFIMGGAVEIDGRVEGSISIMGGSVSLTDNAVIEGDINGLGGSLSRSEDARVIGSVNTNSWTSFRIRDVMPQVDLTPVRLGYNQVWEVFRSIGSAFVLAALAMLVALLWPKPTERAAAALADQPVLAGGMGLLTAIVMPVAVVILTVTIILIPAAIAAVILLALALLFGWTALGMELGKRIVAMFKVTWHPALATGLGTLALSLVVSGLSIIPCIGWIFPALVPLVGLGAVVITRFGTQVYPASSTAAAPVVVEAVPAAPIPPEPATPAEPPVPPTA